MILLVAKHCLRPPRIDAIRPLSKEFSCQATAVMGTIKVTFQLQSMMVTCPRPRGLFGDYTDSLQQQQQSHKQETPWISAGV